MAAFKCEVVVLKLSKAAALCVFNDNAASKCEVGIEQWFLRKHDLLEV